VRVGVPKSTIPTIVSYCVNSEEGKGRQF